MAKIEVTVYSTPKCMQCAATKRFLDGNDIPFEDGDLTETVDAIKTLTGFQQAPVVRVFDPRTGSFTFWYGYNPVELGRLKTLV